MASEPPPPPKSGNGSSGLSLYANLLEPQGNAPGSISRAPVVSQQALDAVKEQEAAKKPLDSALRFQPHPQIRRPQPKIQKPKAGFPKALPTISNIAKADSTAAPAQSTLADWAARDDDDYMFAAGEKRTRGGRRKKKKKTEDALPLETDWDEIYDLSRPTNVEEYLRSDERIHEVREWKALLYKHRRRDEDGRGSYTSEEEEDRPMMNQFAPPNSYSFAPPPASPPHATVSDDATGDDVYARRLALSQGQVPPPPPPPPPPEQGSSTISREPVRYAPPEPPSESVPAEHDVMDEDEKEYAPTDEPEQSSNRPGKKGFAARLMSKYGWAKGQGLGAEGTGIINPLRVQVEKRKKKADSDGGGWAEPGNRGKIIGSKTGGGDGTSTSEMTGGKFGPMSNVIVLRDMLDGMPDLQSEMENGLGQEIGEECGDKYGRVERLYIDIEGRRVYIKFTDAVSALRAVNALDGRIFAGNTIVPQFYDPDKFERREYD
ncbi:hypothetical protein F5Y15DRAFT_410487 [Xylariaceae sp. FL0016]|nr:hypothetical protein F5Y15DRAFT_410487 [Xylariaceae sp. FL0016]